MDPQETRIWQNCGIPLTSYQWVGGMFALTSEELARIDEADRNPESWNRPRLHDSLAPLGRDEEFDALAHEDI